MESQGPSDWWLALFTAMVEHVFSCRPRDFVSERLCRAELSPYGKLRCQVLLFSKLIMQHGSLLFVLCCSFFFYFAVMRNAYTNSARKLIRNRRHWIPMCCVRGRAVLQWILRKGHWVCLVREFNWLRVWSHGCLLWTFGFEKFLSTSCVACKQYHWQHP